MRKIIQWILSLFGYVPKSNVEEQNSNRKEIANAMKGDEKSLEEIRKKAS